MRREEGPAVRTVLRANPPEIRAPDLEPVDLHARFAISAGRHRAAAEYLGREVRVAGHFEGVRQRPHAAGVRVFDHQPDRLLCVLELGAHRRFDQARGGDLDTGNGSRDRGAQRRFALLRLAADEGEQQAGGDGCRRRELRARHGATTRWLGRDSRGVVALAGEHASGAQPDADWISARKAKNCRAVPASRQEALQPEGRLQAPPGAEQRRSARTSISGRL